MVYKIILDKIKLVHNLLFPVLILYGKKLDQIMIEEQLCVSKAECTKPTLYKNFIVSNVVLLKGYMYQF